MKCLRSALFRTTDSIITNKETIYSVKEIPTKSTICCIIINSPSPHTSYWHTSPNGKTHKTHTKVKKSVVKKEICQYFYGNFGISLVCFYCIKDKFECHYRLLKIFFRIFSRVKRTFQIIFDE